MDKTIQKATGKISINEKEFKIQADGQWEQYDEDNAGKINKEDFYLVTSSLVLHIGNMTDLDEEQQEKLTGLFDDLFTSLFGNYQDKKMIDKKFLMPLFTQLINVYNSKSEFAEELTQDDIVKLTREALLKELK